MKVEMNKPALAKSDAYAQQNRKLFKEEGVFVMNLIGSPGAGKTAILEHTARNFDGKFAVIIGDVKTALDAERLRGCQAEAYPIETGGACHLNARTIGETAAKIDLDAIDYLFIENVGNLVCPSALDVGEDVKIAVLSVPEGDEKVRKYPALFVRAEVVFINKTDLLPYVDYDIECVRRDCRAVRQDVQIFETSARQDSGFDEWFRYLEAHRPRKPA